MPASPQFIEALVQGAIPVHLLTLNLPADAGGTMRIGKGSYTKAGVGAFDQRVLKWNQFSEKFNDQSGNVPPVTPVVTVNDIPPSAEVGERIGAKLKSIGPFGRAVKLAQVQGSQAAIVTAIKDLDPAYWYVRFVGILDTWVRSGSMGWDLRLRSNDASLKLDAPRAKITSQDWPDAYVPPTDQTGQAVLGKYFPVAFGQTDSTGIGGAGLRPMYLGDKTRNRYIRSLGVTDSLGFSVKVAGVTAAVQPTRNVIIQGGRTCTVYDFATPQGDAIITIDGSGLDLGSYGVYTHPVSQLQFALEHLVFADWNGGAILPATHTDSISAAAVAALLFGREGTPGWLTRGEKTTGEDMIRRAIAATGIDVYWNSNGLLAFDYFEPTQLNAETGVMITQGRDTAGEITLETRSDELWRGITVNGLEGSDGKGLTDNAAFQPSFLDAAPHEVTSQWGPGRVV
jgi:hypothetical protein